MRELDLTVADLADTARVSPGRLRYLGLLSHDPQTLEGLSAALGWPRNHLAHLWSGTSEPVLRCLLAEAKPVSEVHDSVCRADGLTQPELATLTEVSVTTIGHAETGRPWQGRLLEPSAITEMLWWHPWQGADPAHAWIRVGIADRRRTRSDSAGRGRDRALTSRAVLVGYAWFAVSTLTVTLS